LPNSPEPSSKKVLGKVEPVTDMNFQHTIAERSPTPQPQTRSHVFPEHFCLNAFPDAVNAIELDPALSGGGTDPSAPTQSSTHHPIAVPIAP
jgi:hypothetical protein